MLVRQVQIEQHQVRAQSVHRADRLGGRVRLGDRPEAVYLVHVGGVDAGDTEVVVHDHDADHGVTRAFSAAAAAASSRPTQLGRTAVKTAPPSWPTLIIPLRLSTTCRTSASPSPRRAPVAEDFVVTPSMKMASRMSCGTPGPESRTRTSRSWSAATIVSSTQCGRGAWAAASMALSIRFPATVSTSLMSLIGAST